MTSVKAQSTQNEDGPRRNVNLLTHDDNKGVTDPLNETQPDGRGIAVNTKYFLTFTDLKTQASVQRKTQLLTDEPLQFFYTANFRQKNVQKSAAKE